MGAIQAGFVYDLPKLIVSVSEVRVRVGEGQSKQASFLVRAEDRSVISGRVLTESSRVHLAADRFSGTDCQINFTISAAGLSAGQKVHVRILVRTALSEVTVPVHVEIVEKQEEGFDPEIRTLDDFSNLCQKNLREGFRLFTSEGFPGILNGNNRQYLALYKGMSHNPVTYQHLEEFLVSTGKKKPIEFSLDKQEKAVYHLDVSQKDTLYVYRNTWGYVRLEIDVEGDFLEVDKRVITADDFIGKVYGLEYIVHRDKLGSGKTYGKIRIRSVHQSLEYVVEASARGESEIRPSAVRNRRVAWLMRDYLNLQLHILDYPGWAESSAMTIGEMLEEDPNDTWAILYQAYLAYSQEDTKKVIEVLWPIKEGQLKLESGEQRGLYLFLAKSVQLIPDESRNILPTLRKYYARNPSSYLLLKLIHSEEDPESVASADRMQEYEDCFRAGCTSPFLYLDAWNLLKKEESLLRRLSSFMVQVLCFGEKNGTITEGLLQRAAFLSDNQKTFHRSVFRLLADGYKKYPNDEILEAVCKLLIKGDPVRKECFPWYARAVERDVRVTRLYEYYMETYYAPASEELPLPIRMYFATNNTLGEKKKALLYASIVLHKNEDETSYLNYAKTMRTFAADGLRKGRIDENYAILYHEFFRHPDTPEAAALLARVLFARKITVQDPRMRKVIVCQHSMKEESSAVLRDGVAYPDVVTDDACIFVEDARQRRFATTVPYQVTRLMDEKESAKAILDTGVDDEKSELFMCHEKAWQMDINSVNIRVYRQAVRNEAFTDEYRGIIRKKLLTYDMEHPEEELLPDALPPEELDAYASADKVSTATILIRAGRYEHAFSVIRGYGYEGIDRELLLKMASGLLAEEKCTEEESLVQLCWHIFDDGLYDERILVFLRDRYDGSLKNLCHLWEKLKGFQIESLQLEERILLLAIQTHQFPEQETEILRSYIKQQGRQEVVSAYLAYLSDYYFLGHRKTGGQIFIIMEGAIQRGELPYTICRLALLKYYSEIGTLNHARTELARKLLAEMDAKGYRFEFYNRLPKSLIQAYQIEDKVFIEEQYSPDSHVILHYQLTEQDGMEGQWLSEPMKNVYHGIFVKEFLLFYGEKLTYYLSIIRNGKTRNTDSYQVSLMDMDTSGRSRYKLLNHMLEARDKNDTRELEKAMDTYLMQENYVDKFLQLMP